MSAKYFTSVIRLEASSCVGGSVSLAEKGSPKVMKSPPPIDEISCAEFFSPKSCWSFVQSVVAGKGILSFDERSKGPGC